jgi:hypothetical protein
MIQWQYKYRVSPGWGRIRKPKRQARPAMARAVPGASPEHRAKKGRILPVGSTMTNKEMKLVTKNDKVVAGKPVSIAGPWLVRKFHAHVSS